MVRAEEEAGNVRDDESGEHDESTERDGDCGEQRGDEDDGDACDFNADAEMVCILVAEREGIEAAHEWVSCGEAEQ